MALREFVLVLQRITEALFLRTMRPGATAEADLPNIYPANPIWNRPFIPLHVNIVSFPFRTIEGQPSNTALSTVLCALVVNDDPIILMDTTSILADTGFWVHGAMDGEEAKHVLADHCESVVLLFSDVDMPGPTNGFALARHADRHWPHIEIVIASCHVLPQDGDIPDRATFVTKPFSKRTVHEHLAKMLPNKKKPEPLTKAV